MIDASPIRAEFVRRFGREPRLFHAPGRVNLIGEHIDYNDGFVLPMAIDRGTLVAAATRSDRRVRAVSLVLDETIELDLDRPLPARMGGFVDYLQGVAQVLDRAGPPLPGVDLLVASDLPLGGGLSSSASLEVALALAWVHLGGRAVDRVALALACQQAEHEYVGTACGIMDSFAAVLAHEGSALLVDCRSLEHRPVPLDPVRAVILVCDSGVRHELASSPYNQRRAECQSGLLALRAVNHEAKSLRDIDAAALVRAGALLPEPLRRRCRHVVSEIARTRHAAARMDAGDLAGFGAAMLASHDSLRDDYEVSTPELDFLVALSSSLPGVYGARMTGAGFGGCTISLVDPAAVDRVGDTLTRGYRAQFGHHPRVFVTAACGSAGEIVPR